MDAVIGAGFPPTHGYVSENQVWLPEKGKIEQVVTLIQG
jgi:hypothetical protein